MLGFILQQIQALAIHTTMILKRSSHTVPEGSLLPTTNDDNGAMKSLRKLPPKQKHRRSGGKKKLLVSILGYTILGFVIFLYVVGTRHVLLMTSSYSARERIDNFSLNPRTGIGLQDNDAPRMARSLPGKPRVIGYYYDLTDSESFVGTERLDPNMNVLLNSKTRIMREVFMTPEQVEKQEYLLHSKSYDYGKADTLQHQGKDCVAQYDWMEKSFPTCNLLMEVDHSNLNYLPIFHENHYNNKHDEPVASGSLHSYSALIASGGWRDVWTVENFLRHNSKQEETFILKTMKYEHEFEERNYDRHRRDHVAMERLTASKFIMNIYGFCGNSGLFEYANGGDLTDSIWYNYHPRKDANEKPWTPEEKMIVAYQAATGLADMHNFAKEGVAAVVHADIAGDQYVYVEEDGVYKLNDFNRARFLAINSKTNELCNFTVGSNSGTVSEVVSVRYESNTVGCFDSR